MSDDEPTTDTPREGWSFPAERSGASSGAVPADAPAAPAEAATSPRMVLGLIVVLVGLLSSVIAMVIGISMATQNVVVGCPDGTISDTDATPVCHSYPHAGQGAGLALLAVAIGCVIVFAAYIAYRLTPPTASE